jgi:hypothetical protein
MPSATRRSQGGREDHPGQGTARDGNPWPSVFIRGSQSSSLPEGVDVRAVRRARIVLSSCPSWLHGENEMAYPPTKASLLLA